MQNHQSIGNMKQESHRVNFDFCMGGGERMVSVTIGGVSPQTSALNQQTSGIRWRLHSGKRLYNYGKSPFSKGKSTNYQ